MSMSTTSGRSSAASVDAGLPVACLADDLEVGLAAEHERQRRADQRVVVHDEQTDPDRQAAHGIQPRSTKV